jgi:hypothetical protein
MPRVIEVTEASGARFIGTTLLAFVIAEGALFLFMDFNDYVRHLRIGYHNIRSFILHRRR